jgi:hypothetical protein
MNTTRLVRYSLWASVPFNVLAAYMLAFPASALGQLAGLPQSVPAIHAGLLSFIVLLFGGVYAWLASRPEIDRPLLAIGAIGKSGVFAVTLVVWLAGASSGRTVLLASGDLAFASLWAWWLVSRSSTSDRRQAASR